MTSIHCPAHRNTFHSFYVVKDVYNIALSGPEERAISSFSCIQTLSYHHRNRALFSGQKARQVERLAVFFFFFWAKVADFDILVLSPSLSPSLSVSVSVSLSFPFLFTANLEVSILFHYISKRISRLDFTVLYCIVRNGVCNLIGSGWWWW